MIKGKFIPVNTADMLAVGSAKNIHVQISVYGHKQAKIFLL